MAGSDAARLYTPTILALAVELADCPLSDHLPQRGEARSRSCGSTVAAGFRTGADGAVEALGLRVTACAIGQASAALFARHAKGRDIRELEDAHDAIARWLGGDTTEPDWPDIAQLEPARAFRARHDAILLPWKAAMDALCKARAES